MFGYVNVYKDELKIKDYDTYRAYYCGLCKMLGKNHNQLVRLCLNYDFTFLAVMLDALCDDTHSFVKEGCIKKTGKRKIIYSAQGLEFSADMNVIMAYYKLMDDIKDNHSIKSLIGIIPFVRRAYKIKKRYPVLCRTISDSLKRLSFLEEMQCDVTDKTAHEFAVIMQAMFSQSNIELADFGYQLGRIIYIMDAYDDMNEDFTKGKYNPANRQYSYDGKMTEDIKKAISDNLYFTLSELSRLYEKLDIRKNKEILDNIIYLGMRAKCDMIINERNKKNEKSV